MAYRVAINGLGRIGRTALKIALTRSELEVVAANDLAEPENLAYLIRYDTVYGPYEKEVAVDGNDLHVDGHKVALLAEPDPAKLPWRQHRVDVVIEATGVFTDTEKAAGHLAAGAKAVIISAPAKSEKGEAPTGVLGVNVLAPAAINVFSNASCTTNCITPVMAMLESGFGVKKAFMTTVHAYTAGQALQDAPDAKDWRRGRAAAANIVPTSTGAAKTTGQVISSLKETFDGIALRVPVITGSIADITALLNRDTTSGELNDYFTKNADRGLYKGIVKATTDPLVSSDVIGSTYSAIIDLSLTKVVAGDLVKVIAWYDNERGYSERLVDQVISIARQLA